MSMSFSIGMVWLCSDASFLTQIFKIGGSGGESDAQLSTVTVHSSESDEYLRIVGNKSCRQQIPQIGFVE